MDAVHWAGLTLVMVTWLGHTANVAENYYQTCISNLFNISSSIYKHVDKKSFEKFILAFNNSLNSNI